MKVHELKTWPSQFERICDGSKTFEVRQNDRNFITGDMLILREWDSENGYSGRQLTVRIGYVMQGVFGLSEGICVMSLLSI